MQWIIFGPYGALLSQTASEDAKQETADEWQIERCRRPDRDYTPNGAQAWRALCGSRPCSMRYSAD